MIARTKTGRIVRSKCAYCLQLVEKSTLTNTPTEGISPSGCRTSAAICPDCIPRRLRDLARREVYGESYVMCQNITQQRCSLPTDELSVGPISEDAA
jgi:hypothetical protein